MVFLYYETAAPSRRKKCSMHDRYLFAIHELENAAFDGVRCQHGALLVDDCNECEPILAVPGFEPEPFNYGA